LSKRGCGNNGPRFIAGIPIGTNISPYWGNGFLWSAAGSGKNNDLP